MFSKVIHSHNCCVPNFVVLRSGNEKYHCRPIYILFDRRIKICMHLPEKHDSFIGLITVRVYPFKKQVLYIKLWMMDFKCQLMQEKWQIWIYHSNMSYIQKFSFVWMKVFEYHSKLIHVWILQFPVNNLVLNSD